MSKQLTERFLIIARYEQAADIFREQGKTGTEENKLYCGKQATLSRLNAIKLRNGTLVKRKVRQHKPVQTRQRQASYSAAWLGE